MLKPPVLAEVDPVKHEMGSTTVVDGGSMAKTGADSMVVGEAVLTMFSAAMPTIGEAVSTMVSAAMPMMVGEAASVLMSIADDAM
jgi:hypothetical protein